MAKVRIEISREHLENPTIRRAILSDPIAESWESIRALLDADSKCALALPYGGTVDITLVEP